MDCIILSSLWPYGVGEKRKCVAAKGRPGFAGQRTGWDSLIHFDLCVAAKFHRRRTCVKFSQLSCTNHYIITIYSGQRSLAHYFENGTKL